MFENFLQNRVYETEQAMSEQIRKELEKLLASATGTLYAAERITKEIESISKETSPKTSRSRALKSLKGDCEMMVDRYQKLADELEELRTQLLPNE